MNSSDFRAEARKNLSGKWKSAVLITLAYIVVFSVISIIEQHVPEGLASLISLLVTIIEIPLSFGFIFSLYKLFNNEETKAFDFLSLGFSNFGKSWGIALRILLKMILPIILLIVSLILISARLVGSVGTTILSAGNADLANLSGSFSGISIFGIILYFVSLIWIMVRSFLYQLSFIIAADDENLSSKESVEKSEELMNGNRWKLFCLQLSFIGWAILACFTFGIGFFWLIPYIQFAEFAFYRFLSNNN